MIIISARKFDLWQKAENRKRSLNNNIVIILVWARHCAELGWHVFCFYINIKSERAVTMENPSFIRMILHFPFYISFHNFFFLIWFSLRKIRKEWNDQKRMHAHVWCAVSYRALPWSHWKHDSNYISIDSIYQFCFYYLLLLKLHSCVSIEWLHENVGSYNKFEWIKWNSYLKWKIKWGERNEHHFSWNNETKTDEVFNEFWFVIWLWIEWMNHGRH